MTMEIIECEQGSAAWFEARRGIPTASEFSTVMSEGKDGTLPVAIIDAMVASGCTATQLAAAVKAARARGASPSQMRLKYLRTLAGEIIRGTPEDEGYSNAAMERGKALEAEARETYAFANGVEPQLVGFIRNGRAGASPDSLIGEDGGLEIKTALAHIQFDRLQKNELPSEHRAQVQGNLWITGRRWWDFVSYSPGLLPLIVRVERDEAYIAQLAKAVDAFNAEIDHLLSAYSGPDQFRAAAA
jgi:hypothetical protein